MYENTTKFETFQSPACKAAQSFLQNLAQFYPCADGFPMCAWFKHECNTSHSNCGDCLADINSGNVENAVKSCETGTVAGAWLKLPFSMPALPLENDPLEIDHGSSRLCRARVAAHTPLSTNLG